MQVIVPYSVGCGLSGGCNNCQWVDTYFEIMQSIFRRSKTGESDETIMVDLYDVVWEDIRSFLGGVPMSIGPSISSQPT